MTDMWALSPDTEGVTCSCGDAVGDALCMRPDLRGLEPQTLAGALGVSRADAVRGIQAVTKTATGRNVAVRGSLDEELSRYGAPAPKVPIMYGSPDARGFPPGDTERHAKGWVHTWAGDAAGFGALGYDAGATTGAGEVLAVTDHTTYWEIRYADGSDEIPKDPAVLDSQATLTDMTDPALAKRLRLYAKNIRDIGQPMPTPTPSTTYVVVALVAAGGLFLLRFFR